MFILFLADCLCLARSFWPTPLWYLRWFVRIHVFNSFISFVLVRSGGGDGGGGRGGDGEEIGGILGEMMALGAAQVPRSFCHLGWYSTQICFAWEGLLVYEVSAVSMLTLMQGVVVLIAQGFVFCANFGRSLGQDDMQLRKCSGGAQVSFFFFHDKGFIEG